MAVASPRRRSISDLPHAADLEAEPQVVADAHVRIERIGLEHHGDAAIARWQVIDQLAADLQLAMRDCLESGDHSQHRRLAAAGGADEHHEGAVLDVEVDALDGDELAVDLDDVAQGDGGQSPLPTAAGSA